MTYRLHDITGTRFSFGTDHGSTLVDPAKRLAQILCSTYKRYFKVSLIDMVHIICRREYFTLIDIVNLDRFENLSLHKMTDSAFGHNRDSNSILDPLNHLRITHTGNTAGCTDICRYPFQSHDSTGTCCFRNLCLLRCGDIHDDTAL